jgi:hypothetical protein
MKRATIHGAIVLVLLLFPGGSSFTGDKDKEKLDVDRKQFERQWSEVVNKYPAVARAYLHQQIEHTKLLTAIFAEAGESRYEGTWGALASASRHEICCEGVEVGSQLIMLDRRLCGDVLCSRPPEHDLGRCADDCLGSDKYDQPGQDRGDCLSDCLKPFSPSRQR